MKRFLIALMLVVMVIPCVFAEEASKSEINWEIIDSVGVNAALDHISMRGKFNTSDVVTNKMTGFGVGLLVEADLSEIPNFMKPGWYAYSDLGFSFSKKIMFVDNEYTNETADSILGIKSHLCVMKALDLKLPFEVRVGGGFAFNRISATSDTNLRMNARAFGIAVVGEGLLKIGVHFGISLVANADMSLATKIYSREKSGSGLVTIQKRSSFGLGLDVAVRLGAKYII